MKKISIIILLVLCLTLLLLTGCMTNTVTPEIDMGNSGNQTSTNPNSNNYQNPSTDPVEEPVTEEPGTVEVDTTKPVITGSRAPLPNSFGWNNTDVTVSFSCADTGLVQSGIDINTVAGATLTAEGKDQSVTNTGVCTDVAGNTADTVTVSNINIDKTPPVVTITLPGTGEYVLNQSITATWSATDTLSGVVSPASGTVSIDTSSVGTKTFTLPAGSAKDKAGNNLLKVTKSYSVIADTEETETGNSQKWSGLGMGLSLTVDIEIFDGWVDTLLANGFDQLRMHIPHFEHAYDSKPTVLSAIAKGAKVIWGVGHGYTTITADNWATYRQAILDEALWAQDNGVYEFQLGNEEELHVDGTTMTVAQVIANLKSVATDVQAIFTRGNISYSCSMFNVPDWVSAGKGDIDILAANVYKADYRWQSSIDDLVNTFGADGTYLTEFNWGNLDGLPDETEQAEEISTMIEYIKASGMTRAFFFCWHDWEGGLFGVVKDDGTYRLLWDQAILNSGSVKFATVPTKTATISLPNTIAFMPK